MVLRGKGQLLKTGGDKSLLAKSVMTFSPAMNQILTVEVLPKYSGSYIVLAYKTCDYF